MATAKSSKQGKELPKSRTAKTTKTLPQKPASVKVKKPTKDKAKSNKK